MKMIASSNWLHELWEYSDDIHSLYCKTNKTDRKLWKKEKTRKLWITLLIPWHHPVFFRIFSCWNEECRWTHCSIYCFCLVRRQKIYFRLFRSIFNVCFVCFQLLMIAEVKWSFRRQQCRWRSWKVPEDRWMPLKVMEGHKRSWRSMRSSKVVMSILTCRTVVRSFRKHRASWITKRATNRCLVHLSGGRYVRIPKRTTNWVAAAAAAEAATAAETEMSNTI